MYFDVPACKHANTRPLPYHAAAVGSGNYGGLSEDRWRLVLLVFLAVGAGDREGDGLGREGDGLGRWNSSFNNRMELDYSVKVHFGCT